MTLRHLSNLMKWHFEEVKRPNIYNTELVPKLFENEEQGKKKKKKN